MREGVEAQAAAKINLALHVLNRRADSYHQLDTIAVFADLGERIFAVAADDQVLRVEGPFAAHAPKDADNLVLKAAELLRRHADFRGGAEIRLVKKLPAGAGFGGGSADAGATLHALNRLWSLGLGLAELSTLARTLGADVAMCLVSTALRARGTGDRIEPLGFWPPLPLVLAWPGQPLSTAAVFAALAPRDNPPLPDPLPAATPAAVAGWLAECRNDLEDAALRLAPAIGEALARLRATEGCLIARMSGSGSGCFGLYADIAGAGAAAADLRRANPGWWIGAALAG